ncbi:DUF1015 family protein [Saccharopolyspora sp. NPDC049426]|uniref:DUF1015 family protein n=1 Tax=Saccharopolyspora sp. NPDC049426 TaxID=3155652 RepID=UPI00342C907B
MSTPRTEATDAGVIARLPRGFRVDRRGGENPAGAMRIREALGSDRYQRMPGPAAVVYRIANGNHEQTGVIVEVPVEEYEAGRIRPHEATQPDRQRLLEESTAKSGIERTPVTLAHSPDRALRSVTESVTRTEPDVDLTAADGTRHTAWFSRDAGLARATELGLRGLDALYIADGHHRMAAAQRYVARHHVDPEHPAAFTLAALFPADEMRVFGYHRCLPASGEAAAGVLAKLDSSLVLERWDGRSAAIPEPGVVVVRFADEFYRLKLRPHGPDGHVRTSLDIVSLDEEVLPGLGISPTSCGNGPPESCRHPADEAVLFVARPPSVEQIMAVSDAGLVMPPKSTWFAPKPAPGLFLRDLTDPT